MAVHLVQLTDGITRRAAVVDEPHLRLLANVSSVYSLAQRCLRGSQPLEEYVHSAPHSEELFYDDVYSGSSPWRLLAPIDVPGEPSRVLVSGTGLTHVGSARQRQAMHLDGETRKKAEADKDEAPFTDSMRMFRLGIEGGRPEKGLVGVAPEWFYKGDGSVLRAHLESLVVPGFAEDGGEEAEIAGVYIVDDQGIPYRIGFVQGNEFSDHVFEKRNYLNLAGSKLRTCSIGPELVVGSSFENIAGKVSIQRGNSLVWQKTIASGVQNMCHSLANIEHHHFKFAGHRQPGNVHVHFFGADALSFGDGVALENNDTVSVQFDGLGRSLINSIRVEAKSYDLIRVNLI